MDVGDAPSQRHLRLLRNIELSDNIHAATANEIAKNPNGYARQTRARVTYEPQTVKKEVPKVTAAEWALPEVPQEANALSPYVEFVKVDSARGTYLKHYVKLRYNAEKLLSFENLFKSSAPNHEKYQADFEVYEPETLFNRIDNNCSRPYRCAIADKKDYSTQRTTPSIKDRERFLKLLHKASPASYYNGNLLLAFNEAEDRALTNPKRLKSKRAASKIEYIYFRDYEIKTWYTAPYPEEFNRNKILYICEHCLKYMNSRYIYHRHLPKCPLRHPPGTEIYRGDKISIWEVDGRENVIYCQNLCLLAKLFLNSKTLYYDVEPFIFYILTEREDAGGETQFHFVGYFSKEKLTSTDYNLSCILTLPIYQRRGYGHLLVDFSYLLTRREYKWGTPEKPLSDLGLLSYRNFWKIKICEVLQSLKSELHETEVKGNTLHFSIEDLSNLTGMIPTDVVFGLEQLGALYQYKEGDKCRFAIKISDWSLIEKIHTAWTSKTYDFVRPEKLVWKPMIFGPSCGINAMGTMIETTTGTTRTTTAGQQNGVDLFKNSVSVLVNFMRDDIDDARSMEEICYQKIRGQQTLKFDTSKVDSMALACHPPGMNNIRNAFLKQITINSKVRDNSLKDGEATPPIASESDSNLSLVDPALMEAMENKMEVTDEPDVTLVIEDMIEDAEADYSEDSEEEEEDEEEQDEDIEGINGIQSRPKRTRSGRVIKRLDDEDESEDGITGSRRLRSMDRP